MGDAKDGTHDYREATIRRSWLDQVVTETQRMAGRFAAADRDEARDLLQAFALALPPTNGRFERVMLREILLDVAFKCGSALHQRLHGSQATSCAFEPSAVLDRFWVNPHDDAITQFERWRTAFFDELTAAHPPSLASSIGRLVKREFEKPWPLESLAKRFRTSPAHVRRAFFREFGLSVHEYQRLARLVAALGSIRSEKVDSVSYEVGYKSKKNFYHAFVRLTGITPGAFRKLPNDSAAHLQIKASACLIRPDAATLAERIADKARRASAEAVVDDDEA